MALSSLMVGSKGSKNKICASHINQINLSQSNGLLLNTIILMPLFSLLFDHSNRRNLIIFECFLIPLIFIVSQKKRLNTAVDSVPFKGIPHLASITKQMIDDLHSNIWLHELNERSDGDV